MAELTLDQIDDWFNINKKIEKIIIRPGATRGRGILPQGVDEKTFHQKAVPHIPSYKNAANHSNDYAKYFQEQEENELKDITSPTGSSGAFSLFHQSHKSSSSLNQVEEGSLIGSVACLDEFINEGSSEVYKRYSFNHEYDPKLIITSYQEEIVNMINSNEVTVIQGATGCGKTTQVPQYILDYHAKRNIPCNIIVTQPRRIAAISIAKRVCQERKWNLGNLIGYQVGLSRTTSPDTCLLYCTTGILLQKLITAKHMNDYTHVILDEIHERDQEMDFALLIVRKLLRLNSKAVKIILMSATFDVSLFTKYFSIPLLGKLEPAPTIYVSGVNFPVTEYYLEDLKPLGQLPDLNSESPEIQECTYNLVAKLILYFDKIEREEQRDKEITQRGTVLVFLPGLEEINNMDKRLQTSAELYRLTLLPLHSSITSEEQNRVFIPPKAGRRKVILATNIGESSITVSDIKYVIDFCLVKQLVRDPETGFTSLTLAWASKANCIQRKGRAGRVSAGRVYRIVTRHFYSNALSEFEIPEMQRCPMEQLILQVKLLNLGEPKAILGLALQPPNLDDIEINVLLLKEVAALTLHMNGKINAHNGDITFIGRVLASLPLDIHLGKLLVLGHVFGCLDECLIIAAALSVKSIFSKPFKMDLEAYKSKMSWADNSFSDCLAVLYAYRVWEQYKKEGVFNRHGSSEQEWGFRNMIQTKRMHDVQELILDLEKRLSRFNIRKSGLPVREAYKAEYLFILKIVLCGAFYPNYFIQSHVDANDVLRDLNGQDPMTTVMVSGLPNNQGSVYAPELQEIFKKCGRVSSISFENTKAYVSFEKAKTKAVSQNMILPSVYLAIKMRLLRLPLMLNLLKPDEIEKRIVELNIHNEANKGSKLKTNRIQALCAKIQEAHNNIPKIQLPSLEDSIIEFIITSIVDASHFWGQYAQQKTLNFLQDIQNNISLNFHKYQHLRAPFNIGTYCLAPFKDTPNSESIYYRAKIIAIVDDHMVEVLFLDYGNFESISVKQLLCMDPFLMNIPVQAFECFLSQIKPSAVKNPQGKWSAESTFFVDQMVRHKKLYGKIYSIINDEFHLEVYVANSRDNISLNEHLKKCGFADFMEESLLSKKNHELRQSCLRGEVSPLDIQNSRLEEHKVFYSESSYDYNSSKKQISLKGPFSPLEISFSSLLRTGRMRSVRMEKDSINSISLEEEPQEHYSHLLVASHVTVSPVSTHLIAKNTTLLPGIHGFPALMALVFSPTAELRTDPKKIRYTGALCGLGYDLDTKQSLFPDHDMEVVFDTEINLSDIVIINCIRTTINTVLGIEEETLQWGEQSNLRLQEKAQRQLLELMGKTRKSIEPHYFSKSFRWSQFDINDLYCHELEGRDPNTLTLLPLHNPISVKEGFDPDL